MPKIRELTQMPPMPEGDAEQQIAALRDYLFRICEELTYLLTHLEADNINDSTFERINQMIPKAYTGLPVMDGAASSGQSAQWARGDHRHGHDTTKADVTALEETADDLADHIADKDNPHEVTKAQVGLGNVANERQYSAQNPPPIPTPGEVGAIPTSEKGTAGGVAELDSNGMVPSAQLPSYVDDVLEYASLSDFPVTGESGKIYVALDTGRTYRWSGSAYTEISESLALGETSSTAYRGDRGKIAYDHSQVVSGNPHNVTAAEVGARPDTWTPSASDVGAQPTITASGMLKGDGLGGVSAATAGTDYQAPLTAGVDYQTPLVAGTDYQTPLVAGTDYQTPLVAGTDYATPAQIPTVPDPSDAAPQDLGTAAAGSSGDYSRADHVHNLPDADDIGYDNTGSGLSASDVQAALDELAAGGGGGGPSPATATPVMDGTGAVGTSLLYAREDHEHPSDTAKQDEITANGILKGDGAGGVSAATAGTDYQTPLAAGTDYQTPLVAGTDYQTPLTAGTDYQTPLVAGTDYATPGMIPSVPSAYTSNPAMDGTASPGSSGSWARGNHVHPSDTSRVPVYGMGENLLDNAYFVGGGTGDGVFPVNQRKNTTGTGTGTSSFFIDRWVSDSVWQLDSDGLSFSYREGALYGASIGQRIEANRIPDGLRTVTLSALWSDGTFWTNSATISWSGSWQCVSGTFNSNGLAIRMNNNLWHIGIWNNTSKKLQAVKLEYGTQQTLAHLEGNNYVLNTIPNYGEELRKCLRYYWDAGLSSSELVVLPGIANAGGNSFGVQISTPVLMRKVTPTITVGIEWVRGNGSEIGGYTLNTSNASMLNGFVRGIAIDKTGGYNALIPYFVAINKFIVSVEL